MNDDLLGLLKRIRKAVHDALPDKTDPLELDAAIRENAELGKRYEQLEQMVTRRMGELEAENERLRVYADKLADALPEGGLPQDIENRRAANQALAQENHELRAENERLREALEAMDAKLEVESSFEERGETYVAFYRIPAGPWHKILGLIRG